VRTNLEILTKCHTILVPIASYRVKENIGTYKECKSWCVLYECVKLYEYMAQDNTYYHDSNFEFMIKVKAWKWEWVVRMSQDSSTNKCERVQGSESQPLPNEKHFANYNPLVVLGQKCI
jgi:hypothetical protein